MDSTLRDYRLMIVDDEVQIREGLVHAVPWASHGISVVGSASDGEAALSLAEKTLPDIVITDISMNLMDGLEFTEELRKTQPQVGIIILSGYSEFEYARKALDLRVFAYLLKPIQAKDLLVTVGQLARQLDEAGLRGGAEAKEAWLPKPAGPVCQVIREAQAYLEAHFSDPGLCLQSLADHFQLNPTYFSNLYREETGRRYSEDLTTLRLARAKTLLQDPTMRSSDVGLAVGYPNSQYFATLFRRHVGVSPSEFRQGPG